ncbi:MAG: hypothetical protein QOJ76_3333 [Acidobacteriota bacterium]|jgi:hypothetical protein|nr:hypothetical protein [Acidobacteriota bacterium]
MSVAKEQFIVDASGNRTAVLLDIERYQELLEAQEELESIRAFDEAKAADDEAIPFAQAVKEIEAPHE